VDTSGDIKKIFCHKPCTKYAGQENCFFFFLNLDPGPGSGFKNSDLQDPDPAENGPDPQPCIIELNLIFLNLNLI
jgi:hypothetical protein